MRSEPPYRFFDPDQESQEQEPCNSHNCDFTAVDGLHLLIFCTGCAVLKHQFRPYFFLSKNLFKTEVLLASLSLPTPHTLHLPVASHNLFGHLFLTLLFLSLILRLLLHPGLSLKVVPTGVGGKTFPAANSHCFLPLASNAALFFMPQSTPLLGLHTTAPTQ